MTTCKLVSGRREKHRCGAPVDGDTDYCLTHQGFAPPNEGELRCAYCGKSTPPERQACAPWTWPDRGLVTNCVSCAGVCPACKTDLNDGDDVCHNTDCPEGVPDE